MNLEILENPIEEVSRFILATNLKKVTKKGLVDFNLEDSYSSNSNWNGKKLTIKKTGLYKISWGFYQKAILTFYNNLETELALIINNKEYAEIAKITKNTPAYYAVKSSKKIVPIYLKETDVLHLKTGVLNAEQPNICEVYFKVEKM